MPSEDPPPEPPAPIARRLRGLTVLDLSNQLPGPYCTMLLADFGARVIKIEPPGGDTARWLDPDVFAYAGRGKESIVLNLKRDDERRIAHAIARRSAVVVEGFRPGVAARLGMSYADVRTINPDVVYCSLSGYGATGPYSQLPGHDLNYQAVAGWLAVARGWQDARLTERVPVGDLSAGALAAFGITALVHSGQGGQIDLSITDCLFSWRAVRANPPITALGDDGVDPTYDVFPTSDGRYLALGVLEDHFWSALCSALGLSDLLADPELTTLAGRRRQGSRVRGRVAAAIAAVPAIESFAVLSATGTAVSIMNRPQDLAVDAQLRTRPVLTGGSPERPGSIFGPLVERPAPGLDEHGPRLRVEFAARS